MVTSAPITGIGGVRRGPSLIIERADEILCGTVLRKNVAVEESARLIRPIRVGLRPVVRCLLLTSSSTFIGIVYLTGGRRTERLVAHVCVMAVSIKRCFNGSSQLDWSSKSIDRRWSRIFVVCIRARNHHLERVPPLTIICGNVCTH